MTARAVKAPLKDIQSLRALFLQETNFQIRYNACHERGWTDSYLLTFDDIEIGYGSVKGQEVSGRDTIFEFFVIQSFRKFEHRVEPVGDYVVALTGEVVATGGFMLHYNRPFADLYMEVREDCRRRGFGFFLLQELKKECYLAGRVPAARCGLDNAASRATLIKAGLRVCGFMLTGKIK